MDLNILFKLVKDTFDFVSGSSVSELLELLPTNNRPQFYLSQHDFTEEFVFPVAAELAKSTSIKHVNFGGNYLEKDAAQVAAELAKSTSIEFVDFSNNKIGDAEALVIITHLAECKTFHTVIFENNDLEARFIDAVIATGDLERITKVLEHNPSVSSNHIDQVLVLLESQGDQTATITVAGAGAGAGSSDDAEPDATLKQTYTPKLYLALLNLCKKFHIDPDTTYLKVIAQSLPATLSEIGDITLEEEAASGEAGADAGGASAAESDPYYDLPHLEYVDDNDGVPLAGNTSATTGE